MKEILCGCKEKKCYSVWGRERDDLSVERKFIIIIIGIKIQIIFRNGSGFVLLSAGDL